MSNCEKRHNFSKALLWPLETVGKSEKDQCLVLISSCQISTELRVTIINKLFGPVNLADEGIHQSFPSSLRVETAVFFPSQMFLLEYGRSVRQLRASLPFESCLLEIRHIFSHLGKSTICLMIDLCFICSLGLNNFLKALFFEPHCFMWVIPLLSKMSFSTMCIHVNAKIQFAHISSS